MRPSPETAQQPLKALPGKCLIFPKKLSFWLYVACITSQVTRGKRVGRQPSSCGLLWQGNVSGAPEGSCGQRLNSPMESSSGSEPGI